MFFVDKNGNIDYSYANSPSGQIYRYFFSKVEPFKEKMKQMLESWFFFMYLYM